MAERAGPWLAIDSATDRAGLALLGQDGLLEEAHWRGRRRHTIELAPALEAMLLRQKLSAAELAGVAVAIGPGSYTGLRIGLALAKGLALGAGLPIVGLPTLDILAAALSPPEQPRELALWLVLQAGRGRIVAACYPPGASWEAGARAVDWPDARRLEVCRLDDLIARAEAPALVAGELDPGSRERLVAAGLTPLSDAASLRRAGWLAEMGRRRLAAAGPDDPASLSPIYPGAS